MRSVSIRIPSNSYWRRGREKKQKEILLRPSVRNDVEFTSSFLFCTRNQVISSVIAILHWGMTLNSTHSSKYVPETDQSNVSRLPHKKSMLVHGNSQRRSTSMESYLQTILHQQRWQIEEQESTRQCKQINRWPEREVVCFIREGDSKQKKKGEWCRQNSRMTPKCV